MRNNSMTTKQPSKGWEDKALKTIDRIFDNSKKGKGCRLSWDECHALTLTHLSNTHGEKDEK